MKLLNRLRELRDEHYPLAFNEANLDYLGDDHIDYNHENDDQDDEHLDTIGVGAATVDDIIRLNLEHGYL